MESRSIAWAVVAMSAVAAAGCGPSRLTQLRVQAASDYQCRAVETRPVAAYVEYVSGCGRSDVYWFEGAQDRWVSIGERAAMELPCDRVGIQVGVLDTRTYIAQGCGQRVVYKALPYVGLVIESRTAMAP